MFVYSCACPEGYTGENCTRQACQCQNGGRCHEESGRCECPAGWAGDRCELEPAVLYPRTSPCSAHDCQNGGLCFQPLSGDYQCRCQPGYAGRYCEILGSLSFEAGGYVELDSLGPTRAPVNLTLVFATRNGQSGILAYSAGQLGHVAAELFQGRVRASYDVGNHPVSTMFSYETVADGRPHSLQLLLQGKNLSMRVDQAPARTVVNEGKREFLEPAGALFLGGVPPDVAAMAARQWHLRNATSFDDLETAGDALQLSEDESDEDEQEIRRLEQLFQRARIEVNQESINEWIDIDLDDPGCLQAMLLNGQPLDALKAHARPRTSPGCPGWDPPACLDHRCKKGRCVPADEGYECHCRQGWSGPYCDKGKFLSLSRPPLPRLLEFVLLRIGIKSVPDLILVIYGQ
ncbi:SLIT2 [Cordylochernes scorpioides]|uniref:SLIT2 n=1 Tax=Cordylochernes scorpioides TaxID=51811 RepID=A0ABY6LDG3_9ARAC|nr:SLIT2 [Cordylochernes scorpioides]